MHWALENGKLVKNFLTARRKSFSSALHRIEPNYKTVDYVSFSMDRSKVGRNDLVELESRLLFSAIFDPYDSYDISVINAEHKIRLSSAGCENTFILTCSSLYLIAM